MQGRIGRFEAAAGETISWMKWESFAEDPGFSTPRATRAGNRTREQQPFY